MTEIMYFHLLSMVTSYNSSALFPLNEQILKVIINYY